MDPMTPQVNCKLYLCWRHHLLIGGCHRVLRKFGGSSHTLSSSSSSSYKFKLNALLCIFDNIMHSSLFFYITYNLQRK
jgi:hypothetical protein